MMLLSRFWYAILAVALAAAIGLLYISIYEHNRLRQSDTYEIVSHDRDIVDWYLQLDARRRLDGLAIVGIDHVVQDNLAKANGEEKIDAAVRQAVGKKLTELAEKLRTQFHEEKSGANPIMLFAVDAHGRVVGQANFDRMSATKEDVFELGGFAVVTEALHGWMRDDTWVFDRDTVYRVVGRPVINAQNAPPIGAVVAARRIDDGFAKLVTDYTNAPVAFYVSPRDIDRTVIVGRATPTKASGLWDGFVVDAKMLAGDESYAKGEGASSLKTDKLGLSVIYSRLVGEGWDLGAGYAVARKVSTIADPNGVLANANDTDKQAVPAIFVAAVAAAALLLGVLATWVEHSIPTNKLVREARKFAKGDQDALPLPKLSGPYRRVGQDVNEGLERVIAKGGGASRKAADLEQILGPVPAAPQMSAFAFNLDGPRPAAAADAIPSPAAAKPPTTDPFANLGALPPATPAQANASFMPQTTSPTRGNAPPSNPIAVSSSPSNPRPAPATPPVSAPIPSAPGVGEEEEEEATQVARVPDELMRAATSGEQRAIEDADELLQWRTVFDEFVALRQKCGESTAGLSFEKFQGQLRKNKDALVKQYACKRVKFTVYAKDGKAALKATPIKEA